jgi:hypothetical protein
VTITVARFKDVADGTQRRVLFELDVVKVATFGRP